MQAPHEVTACKGLPLLWYGSPPWAEGGSLLPCGLPWAAGPQLAHHGLHHSLWGNLCSSTSSISILVSPELFLLHFFTPLSGCSCSCAGFPPGPPFLNLLSQRCHHHHSQPQPWSAAGPSWTQLSLAPLSPGDASGSFSHNLLLIPPQNLATQTHYTATFLWLPW